MISLVPWVGQRRARRADRRGELRRSIGKVSFSFILLFFSSRSSCSDDYSLLFSKERLQGVCSFQWPDGFIYDAPLSSLIVHEKKKKKTQSKERGQVALFSMMGSCIIGLNSRCGIVVCLQGTTKIVRVDAFLSLIHCLFLPFGPQNCTP